MGKVIAAITTSVDGYITGPEDGPEYGLGKGGERLHYVRRPAVRARTSRTPGTQRTGPATLDRFFVRTGKESATS